MEDDEILTLNALRNAVFYDRVLFWKSTSTIEGVDYTITNVNFNEGWWGEASTDEMVYITYNKGNKTELVYVDEIVILGGDENNMNLSLSDVYGKISSLLNDYTREESIKRQKFMSEVTDILKNILVIKEEKPNLIPNEAIWLVSKYDTKGYSHEYMIETEEVKTFLR